MYREKGPEDHRRTLGLSQDELPELLVLVGVFDVHHGARRFGRYLDGPGGPDGEGAINHKRFPSWLGTYKGRRVAIAGCLGGPMAAMHAHVWLGAGVPTVVQLGWYGALQPGSQLADVVVPTHAEREDGASDWYLPKGILADASPDLSEAIASRLDARGIPHHRKPVYSTPALMAESREVIRDWSRHGWWGVDMETAATFAVAKSLGARRAGALIRIDDLIEEDHAVTDIHPKESMVVLREREREVLYAVIEAVADTT